MSPKQCESVSVFVMGPTEAGIELFTYLRDTQGSISQQVRKKNRPQPQFRQQICRGKLTVPGTFLTSGPIVMNILSSRYL